VPYDGIYTIKAYGARSGNHSLEEGGKGKIISVNYSLNQGEVIEILVGQMGGFYEYSKVAGGGGTFVVKSGGNSTDDILVIAGGGGAQSGSSSNASANASATICSNNGSNGYGNCLGEGGGVNSLQGGGGGGGFFTSGENNTNACPAGGGGKGYLQGGEGGGPCSPSKGNGGFGGGGSGGNNGAGSGGGYSGGGSGSGTNAHGGGGGSIYNNTEEFTVHSEGNSNHGKVIIILNNPSTYFTSNNQIVQTDEDGNYNLTIPTPMGSSPLEIITVNVTHTEFELYADISDFLSINELNMNISLDLSSDVVSINEELIISGILNLTNGTMISDGSINVYLDGNHIAQFIPLIFGNGVDGSLTISSTDVIVNNYTYLTGNESIGNQSINVNSAAEFNQGDEILIIQMQNYSYGITGQYEFITIGSINSNTINLISPLNNNYYSETFNSSIATSTQVISVPQYTNVIINAGASITSTAWNGYTGGIVVFRANGTVNINGLINASGKGYRGGIEQSIDDDDGQ